MRNNIIDLDCFTEDKKCWGTIELLVAVKSFNLHAIRKRYLSSQKRSKTGSVERREPALGGIVYLKIEQGEIVEEKILAKLTEPRGIDFKNGLLALSSENQIFIFDLNKNKIEAIEDNWLSYIHTVKFNTQSNKILVSSSGVDTIMEFDLQTKKKIWQWLAWEEGYNKGINPKTKTEHILTNSIQKAKQLAASKTNFILITDPQKENLPTALRAAFINSAEYYSDNEILITLFHEGVVKMINRKTKKLETIITGLKKPHGGMKFRNKFLVTDTANGKILIKDGVDEYGFNFNNLKGKDENMKHLEWLQTSHYNDDSIITVDSNRMNFTFFNHVSRKKTHVAFNKSWAVQDFVILPASQIESLQVIENFFNNRD